MKHCPECRKEIEPTPANRRGRRPEYCSKYCAHLQRQRRYWLKRLVAEELVKPI